MAVQYAFSQITTTGLKLAVDAADPLSYPGSGTSWTDVTGNGFTGTVSSSISFATTFRGALVSSNSSSAVSFSGSAANFGAGSFTVEMAFSPSVINGQHWLYSKNSGSFPNFGAFITGSGGSGRITAFYNISSTISCSATTAIGSIVTGSNYIVDVTYAPFSLFTGVYLNSNLVSNVGANGSGSLSTSASLLLLNNTTSSNSGTVGNLYNFKVYNPFIGSANIRKNYNSMCSRFGLPLALYTPPAPFLLDSYPGAAAAYSLRRLSDFYGGSAIQVRRSLDNAVADIGFEGDGNLNIGALLAFCGAGDGFVTAWYDQSGNARNATQTTAINQPQIVSAGSVILEGTKPTLQFDGINDRLEFSKINLTAATSLVALKRNATTTIQNVLDVQDTLQNYANLNVSMNSLSGYGNLLVFSQNTSVGAVNGLGGAPISIYRLYTAIWNGLGVIGTSFYKIYDNNILQSLSNSSAVGPASGATSLIGSAYSGGAPNFFFDGKMQEVILYGIDQTTNIVALNNNINSFYSIY
jgi:hypothetical protein